MSAIKACVLASEAFPILASLRVTGLVHAVERLQRRKGVGEIHKVRVAIRRLRIALSTFRYLDPDDELRDSKRELRRFQKRVGVVRDLDVFIRGALRESSPGLDVRHRKKLRAVALHRRRKAARRCINYTTSKQYRRSIDELRQHAATGLPNDGLCGEPPEKGHRREADLPLGDFARKALKISYAKLRKKELWAQDLDAVHLHSLRIRVKKFRYLTELMAELLPENAAHDLLGLLAAFQDELGEAHDAAVAHTMLEDIGASPPRNSEIPDHSLPTRTSLVTSEQRIHRAAMTCMRTPRTRPL